MRRTSRSHEALPMLEQRSRGSFCRVYSRRNADCAYLPMLEQRSTGSLCLLNVHCKVRYLFKYLCS